MKRGIPLVLAVFTMIVLAESSAWGQRGGFGGGRGGFGQRGGAFGGFGQRGAGRRAGGLGLLGRESVQQELKLSDEQKTKVEELSEQLSQQQREMLQNFRDLSDEERQALRDRQQQQQKEAVAEILDGSQQTRLAQIELQQEGPAALAKEEIAGELGLSDEQQQQIDQAIEEATEEANAVRQEMRGAFSGGFGGGGFNADAFRERAQRMRERTEEVNKKRDERILAVLTEAQREAWTAKLGEAFALQETEGGFGGFRGRRGGGRQGPGRGARRSRPAQELPDDAPQVDAETGEKLIRFNFRYHPWTDVLDWFADQAGLSLHADNKPTGTCNYTDPTSYKVTGALDRLNELLVTKGFILIRKDKTLFCWELVNPIPPSLVPEVSIADLADRGENEMVMVKLFLEKLVAEETAKHLEALKGPFGKVVALPSANLLVITDTAGNVRRMKDVLLGVDESSEGGGLRVFQLRYAQAKEVAAQVRQLLGLPAEEEQNQSRSSGRDRGSRRFSFAQSWQQRMLLAQRQGTQGQGRGNNNAAAAAAAQASVVADTRTNRVLVAAPPNQLALAEQAIETLDTPQGAGDPQLASQLEVYRVTRNDPASVVSFLQEFLGAESMVRLTYDLRSGNIYALGPMAQQVTIRAMIDQMEGGGTSPRGDGRRVFTIGGADLEQLTEMIRVLWRQSGGENPIIMAPTRSAVPPRNGSRLFSPQSLRMDRQRRNQTRMGALRPRGGQEATRPTSTGAEDDNSASPQAAQQQSAPAKAAPKDSQPSAGRKGPRVLRETAHAGRDATVFTAVGTVASVGALDATQQDEGDAQDAAPDEGPTAAQPSGAQELTQAPVIIRLENGVLTVESEDEEALRRIERIVSVLVPSGEQAPFYVAPLYEAEATLVAQTIEQVLTGVSSSSSTQSVIAIGGSMRIIPDTRTNSLLIVGANPTERATIEQLVQVLDTSDLPENALSREPQLIAVKNTSAVEVADVVRDVFSDYLNGAGPNGAQQNGQDPRAAFFLARFGRGRGGNNTRQTAQRSTTGRMTLGVDERTNTIVVSAPSALFDQVRALVQQLDEAALTTNRSIRVVPVALSNVTGTQQTLSLLFGGSSSSSQSNSRGRGAPTGGGFGRPAGFQGGFPRGGFGGGFRPNFGNTDTGNRGNFQRGGFGRGGFTRGGNAGDGGRGQRGGFFGRGGFGGGRGGDATRAGRGGSGR